MQFHVLGGLAVYDGERAVELSARKQRAVLAMLLLERDRVVSVDRLIDNLWSDDADKALASLQVYISRLRGVLEPNRRPRDPATVLLSQPPGYRLAISRDHVDLFRFEDLAAGGRALLLKGEYEAARTTLDAALAMWTGDVLPEFADEPFVIAAASRAADARVTVVESAAETRLELGDQRGAIDVLQLEVEASPTRERLHSLLALAMYRDGRQPDALRIIDRCRRALVESAGLDLGPDLKRLEADLLAHAPDLAWSRREAAPTAPSTPDVPAPEAEEVAREQSPAVVPGGLVGRQRELATLQRAVLDTAAGSGGVAVLIGEPGIGKTRLAEAIVEFAEGQRVATAWTRCPESRTAPPFWAVTDIGNQLRSGAVSHAVGEDPGYRSRLRSLPEGGGDTTSRFDLYRSTLASLGGIDRPAVLVIDDVQWADPDTLRLLEHIVPELATTKVLLVLTSRPLVDESPPGLVDCLAEITRARRAHTVRLGGLDADDIAEWLTDRAGKRLPLEIAEVMRDRTAGNPLFIRELTELLAAEGNLDDAAWVRSARSIPPGVQFVVRRRVSRLPPATQQLLSVAAVVGPTFDIETLAAAAGVDVGALLDNLSPALDASLIVETAAGLGFSHALVADALAAEVNAVRKAAAHAAAARSLAARFGPAFGDRTAAVAHHALEGLLAGTGDLAIEASKQAARLATSRTAHEDAAAHWGNVASAFARCRPSDVGSHIEALIEQAQSLRRVSMIAAAKVPTLAAIERAESAGLAALAIRAAALLNNTHVRNDERHGTVDERIVGMLERILRSVPADDLKARAELLGGIATELTFGDRERHRLACRRSEDAARASNDHLILAKALINGALPSRPARPELRKAALQEAIDLCAAHDLPAEIGFVAHQWLAGLYVEAADFERASRELHSARERFGHAATLRWSSIQRWFDVLMAVTTAQYDHAEALIAEAFELHRRGQLVNAKFMRSSAQTAIALDRGGAEQFIAAAEAAARRSVDDSAGSTATRDGFGRSVVEAMAFTMLEVGRADLAAALAASVVPGSGFLDDFTYVFAATAALHVRTELGQHDAAQAIADDLAPYAERWADVGAAAMTMGPVTLALARHEAATGNVADAARLFASAIEICERAGAPAWLARSLVFQGGWFHTLGDTDKRDVVINRAGELAAKHGFPYVRRRIDLITA